MFSGCRLFCLFWFVGTGIEKPHQKDVDTLRANPTAGCSRLSVWYCRRDLSKYKLHQIVRIIPTPEAIKQLHYKIKLETQPQKRHRYCIPQVPSCDMIPSIGIVFCLLDGAGILGVAWWCQQFLRQNNSFNFCMCLVSFGPVSVRTPCQASSPPQCSENKLHTGDRKRNYGLHFHIVGPDQPIGPGQLCQINLSLEGQFN